MPLKIPENQHSTISYDLATLPSEMDHTAGWPSSA